MQHFGAFAVVIAIFVFLAVATVSGIVGDYKKRQAALALVHAAIERGQPIDPALVERLMAPEHREDGLNPLYYRVGGIITVAAGVGVAILSYFVAQVASIAFYPVLGGGIVVACVGVGLIISARVLEAHARGSGTSES